MPLVKTVKPIYDTFAGSPIEIPAGYQVNITGQTGDMYNVACMFDGELVKVIASHDELYGTPPQSITASVIDQPDPYAVSSDEETSSTPVVYPLVPRIYQEFGITWLLYPKQREEGYTFYGGLLADAPGVGKTLQACEAANRVMRALTEKRDPLAYCYPTPDFPLDQLESNTEQENPHPIFHPAWALPHNTWPDEHSPTLRPVTYIVSPNHLCEMWFKYIRKQYPNDSVALCTGDTQEKRMRALRANTRWKIINYEMCRPAKAPDQETDYIKTEVKKIINGHEYTFMEDVLKPEYVKPVTFGDIIEPQRPVCVIFDECHRLKSSKSKQAREANRIFKNTPYKFLLSATPIKREADDLFYQLHILDPMMFGHEQVFANKYCIYDQTQYGKRDVQLRVFAKRMFWVNRIEANKDAIDYFSKLTSTTTSNKGYQVSFAKPNLQGWVLGRSYKDVGMYLPDTISATIPVLMDDKIRKIYEQVKAQFKATFDELGTDVDLNSYMDILHTTRHLTAACNNKLQAVQDLIEDNPGPHLIFCEYTDIGHFLAQKLGTEFVSGETDVHDRMPIILKCIEQGKPVVATGRAVGTGVNGMESCKTIIFYEEDYTPGEMYQRISRVQRFDPNLKKGETKDPILVFYVNVTDSIDVRVHDVQTNRSHSIKDIISVELGVK